jgi:hypothetical protein
MSSEVLTVLNFNLEAHVLNLDQETCHRKVPPEIRCETKKLCGFLTPQ